MEPTEPDPRPAERCADLSLAPLATRDDAPGEPRSRLLRDGADTGRTVLGKVLEAAFVTPFGTLLLTTDDCPHEEALHAQLLDERWREVDRLSLAAAWAPGRLHGLEALGPSAFAFGFFGDDAWRLEVHAPRWSVRRLFPGSSPVARPARRRVTRSSLSLSGHHATGTGGRRHVRA